MRATILQALSGSEGKVKALGLLVVALLALSSLLLAIARPAHAVSTFTVNRTADAQDANLANAVCDVNTSQTGNQCTLRAAIQEANDTANSGGPDLIRFAIRGFTPTAVRTISPTSELPEITQPVTIDGYTQPEASVNTATNGTTNAVLLIELNGSNMVEGNGFTITGGGTTIRGLVINRFKQEASLFDGNGIFLSNLAPNTNNVIEGNFIGTDPGGTQDLGNELAGVVAFDQSTGNRIGGADSDDRNLISGNGGLAVTADSSENTVQGNLIGTDKGGTADLGNGGSGVAVFGSSNFVTNNIIAFNGKDGFSDGVTVFAGTGNRILSNSIFRNVGLGIDLNDDGPTPNDLQDPDTGPNNLQNKPNLTSATTTGTSITIKGTLNSTPNSTFTIQFFSNLAAEPSGNEGRRFLGQKVVSTNANGNTGTFTRGLAQAVPVGQKITATATGPGGNTSEFSAARAVIAQ